MYCSCLPPERVKLTVNSKKETKGRVKMAQGLTWASVIYPLKESKWVAVVYPQNGVRVKMGFCYYSLKESKWATVVYPLIESN